MQHDFLNIIRAIGENPDRDGLKDTPKRAAKAMEYLTQGYSQSLDTIINGALFPSDNDEMIIVKNIELYSLCEHHLLPFIGKCHVAYLPHGNILGLSKIARIVDYHARRLQVQENLTHNIAETMQNVVNGFGVGVIIEAQHLCMMMRGVEKQNSIMLTSSMMGHFRDNPATRAEFMALVNK